MSDRAHVVLPYHKLLDQASEKQQQIGTTGRGIGPAYEDKIGRRGVRVTDLCRGHGAREFLEPRVERANALLQLMGSAAGPTSTNTSNSSVDSAHACVRSRPTLAFSYTRRCVRRSAC